MRDFASNRPPHTRQTSQELRAVRDAALAEADRIEAAHPLEAGVLRRVTARAFDDMARRQEENETSKRLAVR
jgi:hypothetical protein